MSSQPLTDAKLKRWKKAAAYFDLWLVIYGKDRFDVKALLARLEKVERKVAGK